MERVNELSEQLLLHYSAPDDNLVIEVMQLDATAFPAVSDEDLSRYIIVLGQYLVMIQHHVNLKSVEYMLTSKTYEHKLMIKVLKEDWPSSIKTDKVKKAFIIDKYEDMSDMMFEVLMAESEKLMLHDMNKAVESLLNALKKEKSTRSSNTVEY
jgi:hypothetical protein